MVFARLRRSAANLEGVWVEELVADGRHFFRLSWPQPVDRQPVAVGDTFNWRPAGGELKGRRISSIRGRGCGYVVCMAEALGRVI